MVLLQDVMVEWSGEAHPKPCFGFARKYFLPDPKAGAGHGNDDPYRGAVSADPFVQFFFRHVDLQVVSGSGAAGHTGQGSGNDEFGGLAGQALLGVPAEAQLMRWAEQGEDGGHWVSPGGGQREVRIQCL